LRIELGNLVAANSWGSSWVLGREILEAPKVALLGGKVLRSLRVGEGESNCSSS
jgi:hypothetical protein